MQWLAFLRVRAQTPPGSQSARPFLTFEFSILLRCRLRWAGFLFLLTEWSGADRATRRRGQFGLVPHGYRGYTLPSSGRPPLGDVPASGVRARRPEVWPSARMACPWLDRRLPEGPGGGCLWAQGPMDTTYYYYHRGNTLCRMERVSTGSLQLF